jgi:cytochrome P450
VFTVREVERLRARAETIAHELLDALDPAAPADLVASYCALLPLAVISEILGVPPAQRPGVLDMATRAAPILDFGLGWRQYRAVLGGLRDFNHWLDTHVERLRRHPGDDLLSQLIEVQDEQGTLDDRELKSTAGLVLAAGFETTVSLLGNGIALLCQHPGQLDRLRAEPALWPNAVDEVLRLDPPVLMTGREAARDTELAGVQVPADAVMVIILAGANRDPRVFPDPGRFDVARDNARDHVSFSGGRHYCLGAALARMEGEAGLRAIFERFPGLRLMPGAQRRPTRILRGYQTLPARLR